MTDAARELRRAARVLERHASTCAALFYAFHTAAEGLQARAEMIERTERR